MYTLISGRFKNEGKNTTDANMQLGTKKIISLKWCLDFDVLLLGDAALNFIKAIRRLQLINMVRANEN